MFTRMLYNAVQTHDPVYGYGASARSSTLLNACSIDSSVIRMIADGNLLKQGRYTAGTHIPIVSPDEMMSQQPGCIVVLAWNFQQEIIDSLRFKYCYKGRVILPFPFEPREIQL
jgi:hypothetical protein